MRAYFNRFTIEMTKWQALDACHRHDCTEDVRELCKHPKIKRQLKKISDADLKEELAEYGAWDTEELSDRAANEERIIWIAASDLFATRKLI